MRGLNSTFPASWMFKSSSGLTWGKFVSGSGKELQTLIMVNAKILEGKRGLGEGCVEEKMAHDGSS